MSLVLWHNPLRRLPSPLNRCNNKQHSRSRNSNPNTPLPSRPTLPSRCRLRPNRLSLLRSNPHLHKHKRNPNRSPLHNTKQPRNSLLPDPHQLRLIIRRCMPRQHSLSAMGRTST